MTKPESQVESNQETDLVEPLQPKTPDPRSPSPRGLFGKLSREILNQIQQSVFTAGQTALTRTSKAMHADTKEALSRYGVYRLTVEFARVSEKPPYYKYSLKNHIYHLYHTEKQTYHLSHPRPGNFLANVRRLSLSVVLRSPSLGGAFRYPCISGGMLDQVLCDIVGIMGQHTHCHISLQLRRYRKIWPEMFAGLRQLRCFQSVEVELCHAPWEIQNPSLWRYSNVYARDAGVAVEAVMSYLEPESAGMTGPAVRLFRTNLFGRP